MNIMTQQTTPMTTLEEKLMADKSGDFKKELISTFNSELEKLKKELDRGCKPEQFTSIKKASAALKSAITVIEKVKYE